ncbi:pantothenate kinase 4-like protein [Babesia caballi]|uniref:Pantothenate kinase 4-like protein n=1 Tax=Babesia caballi TaxID=5871 RepID=A0AAV4LSH1_BABCB|nr:pantothenate kinase 4-like protein [Babesia caballi]
MGNSIGVDCSYAQKSLLDKVLIAVACSSEKESRNVDDAIAKHSFLSTSSSDDTLSASAGRTFRLLCVETRHVDDAAHLLSQYRRIIRRVALCGNSSVPLLSTLESLLPDSIIAECEHEECLRLGESLFAACHGAVVAVNDGVPLMEPVDASAIKGHLHATVHSGASYQLCPGNKDKPRSVGHSVIGFSAVVSLFNAFLSRYGSGDEARAYIPEIAELAARGSSSSCDMLVKDIYGGACEDIGLPGDLLASSFGKLHKHPRLWTEPPAKSMIQGNDSGRLDAQSTEFTGDPKRSEDCLATPDLETELSSPSPNSEYVPPRADVANSLINVLIINVTHHSALHAQLNGVDTVIFSGPVFENDALCQLTKQYVNRWSKGSMTMLVYRCRRQFSSRPSIASRSRSSAEDIVRGLEQLCLEGNTCVFTAQAASTAFCDASESMTPLHMLRDPGALRQRLPKARRPADYAVETLECHSPHGAQPQSVFAHRPQVVDPLMDAVKRHLHHYVAELPDVILNSNHLGLTDPAQVELFRTQSLLHFDVLGARSIRCAEALSRYRNDTCAILDRVVDTYVPKLEELTLKQRIYLLAGLCRHNDEASRSKVTDSVLASLAATPPTPDDISKLLALQRTTGVAVPEVLDALMNAMELLLNDPRYVASTFPYHAYTASLLGRAGHPTLVALMERALQKGTTPSTAAAASQLLYTISLMARFLREKGVQVVEDKVLKDLIAHTASCHRQLTLAQQEELYKALLSLPTQEGLPDGLSHFVSTKIPSGLPTMCREERSLQLGTVGGVSYVYVDKKGGSSTVLVCVNESGTLTTAERIPSVAPRPCRLLYADILGCQLKNPESDSRSPTVAYRASRSLEGKIVFPAM